MERPSDITRLLSEVQNGCGDAKNRLFELINDDLRQSAAQLVRRKGPAAEATSLVNEVYLRLFRENKQLDLKNRRYFFAAVIDQMTKILDERVRDAAKRPVTTPLDEYADQIIDRFNSANRFTYQQMRDALKGLKRSRNERKARRHRMLEFYYFGGLSIKDAAKLVEISYSQAREDKRLADAELYQTIMSKQP